MAAHNTWTDHFPGNLLWSNATLVCKGMAPYGAVALGEIERICARLREREGEPAAWGEEWCNVAALLEQRADEAAAEGRQATAGNLYLRAGSYYYTGERFVPLGAHKLDIYRKALRCSQQGLRRRHPNIEFVEVPYEGQTLPAYFIKAQGTGQAAPVVVLFDGMDNCKEMSVLFAGLEFAQRGIHTLAIDGPGQGESLRLRNIHARPDYEVAGTAAYDFVAARADVAAQRVAIMGYSFGGYYAPRIAAFERRYAACVALGALHWDLHAWQSKIKEQLKADPKKSAQSNFQFQWILGLSDSDAALERARAFSLAGIAGRITCPFLVTHGENDRVVPVAAAHQLYAEVGSKNKTLKIFKAEETGAEHCQVDNRQLGIDYIADWISANIGG
jgi:alpha-beta hydrolase superfamily lysophospholipase